MMIGEVGGIEEEADSQGKNEWALQLLLTYCCYFIIFIHLLYILLSTIQKTFKWIIIQYNTTALEKLLAKNNY